MIMEYGKGITYCLDGVRLRIGTQGASQETIRLPLSETFHPPGYIGYYNL